MIRDQDRQLEQFARRRRAIMPAPLQQRDQVGAAFGDTVMIVDQASPRRPVVTLFGESL
jgi:hypothetical protein